VFRVKIRVRVRFGVRVRVGFRVMISDRIRTGYCLRWLTRVTIK